jgi:DNA-binding transcriptional LysR family regulator
MSLRQYEYALTIAEQGSVTAAAERLRVAQPSVSQQIRSLERELGVSLFARTPQGLVPTLAGRAFLREAEVAVSASRRARAAARASAAELTGELVVGTQLGLGTRQLPQAIGALRRQHPGLRVTLHEEPDALDLERLARQGSLDLALVDHLSPQCPFEAHHLDDEPYVAVLPPDLLATPSVSLTELAGEPWVRLPQSSTVDKFITRTLDALGLAPVTVVRTSLTSSAARLVSHGVGVTMMPASAVPQEYEQSTRPLEPAVGQPVIAAIRNHYGPADAALLGLLRVKVDVPV